MLLGYDMYAATLINIIVEGTWIKNENFLEKDYNYFQLIILCYSKSVSR
jgi:hypothetical protein